ncbi:MAG: DUF1570 domain-containing protein [Planctomycetota bacterium]
MSAIPSFMRLQTVANRIGWCLAGCLAIVWGAAFGDEQPRSLATAAWKLESIHLTDGRHLVGLVIDPDPPDTSSDVGFVQVVRPPGKPMYLIAWARVGADRIHSVQRLSPDEHALLKARVQAFRDRGDIRGNAEAAIHLARKPSVTPNAEAWCYEGEWFAMESTADPRLTRQSIVRLTQMFDALQALLPLRTSDTDPSPPSAMLRVRLCGTASEYRALQSEIGIRVANPAFYVPSRRLLVAGSDMPAIIEQERIASEALAATEQRYSELDRALDEGIRRLAADLDKQGVPVRQRSEIVTRTRLRWEREQSQARARIEAARRDNTARVAAARQAFYGWLAHESWHAYADSRFVKSAGGSLPLWLDEGLAQVFETAVIEAGELRLDAADPHRLGLLQELLGSGQSPPLAYVLCADQKQFLIGHGGTASTSRQVYLMSWGLAFHLALLDPLLSPAAIEALVAPTDRIEPVRQFEQLVGMPINQFETMWRARMLSLSGREPLPLPNESALPAAVTPEATEP